MAEKTRRHSVNGPIGKQVGEALARERNARRLTTAGLAEEVDGLGVAMTASTVTKIEKQDRRVTVDELIAFAVALDVSPVTLLLPTKRTESVQITEELAAPWEQTWRWAHGEVALPGSSGDTASDSAKWLADNRPYMSQLTLHEVERLLRLREGFAPLRVEMHFDGEDWLTSRMEHGRHGESLG